MPADAGSSPRPCGVLDGAALHEWTHTAVLQLIAHTDEINQLNVYPVADSDTGTNMLFTMRSAGAGAHDALTASGNDVVAVATGLAAGALHGARGNSGVILSQILRGLADAAAERGRPIEIDADIFAAALRRAVVLAVASVGEVVPGTIVSVVQAAADAAGADTTRTLADTVAAAADAAVIALERTPQQLEVLAEAGVVDAGGRGLVVLLDAMTATLTGVLPPRALYRPAPAAGPRQHDHDCDTAAAPQFEVMYLLDGCPPEALDRLRDRLDRLGESVAIAASTVGAQYTVHVHADDAGAAIEAAMDLGSVSRIQVTALT
ncbi:MAG: DAK2 domain-containing protein, partial [Mycobacterium sp.]